VRNGLGLAKTPLYRNASALILSTIANGAFGLVFWVVAARLYDTDEVGRGAAGVAGLMLVSMLGFTGVQFAMIRFIPAGGRGTARLALTGYGAALAVAIACAAALLVVVQLFIEPLRFLVDSPVIVLAFLGSVLVWVVFSLEDGILTGLRRTAWVPVENAAFGAAKVALLVALSFLGGTWAILVSWSLAAALLIVPVNLALFLKFIPDHARSTAERTGEFTARDIARFSAGNHASGILTMLPDSLMPIIVLNIAGATASAYFYTSRAIIVALRFVAMNISNALTAEGANRDRDLNRLLRWAAILSVAVLAPAVVVLLVEADLVLRIFGREYAENGATLTRLLALGLVPFVVVTLYTAVARVRRQFFNDTATTEIYTGINLSLGIALVSAIDIEGAGIAWLVAQTAAAMVAVSLLWPGLVAGIKRRMGALGIRSQAP
jgi:O-antigen/teichoic acid export membrane protein